MTCSGGSSQAELMADAGKEREGFEAHARGDIIAGSGEERRVDMAVIGVADLKASHPVARKRPFDAATGCPSGLDRRADLTFWKAERAP